MGENSIETILITGLVTRSTPSLRSSPRICGSNLGTYNAQKHIGLPDNAGNTPFQNYGFANCCVDRTVLLILASHVAVVGL
jgi:hypothetical protein